MKKILGIGNALVDVLIGLQDDNFLKEQNLPKGSMQLVDKDLSDKLYASIKQKSPQLTSGGSAANTIHGLAKLGSPTAYIGKIGGDELGTIFSNDLLQNNISPILLKSATETGRALAFISPDSERTFATYLGAAVELSANDLTEKLFEGFDFLHLEGYLVFNHELIEKALALAKSKNIKISLDLASYNVVDANKDFLTEIIKKYIDIVFANEEEAKSLTGQEPEQALYTIADMCDVAVVKVGSKGSMVKRGSEIAKTEAIKAKAIDTTGAGDLYASGFLHGFSQNWPLQKCIELGSLTAGKVVETLGAKIEASVWKEIHNSSLMSNN